MNPDVERLAFELFRARTADGARVSDDELRGIAIRAFNDAGLFVDLLDKLRSGELELPILSI